MSLYKKRIYILGACFTSKTLHSPCPIPNVFKLNQEVKTSILKLSQKQANMKQIRISRVIALQT